MYSFKDLTYITIYDLLQENNSPLMVAYRAYAPIPSARSNDQYSRRHDTLKITQQITIKRHLFNQKVQDGMN
jgi:hypothetical protein